MTILVFGTTGQVGIELAAFDTVVSLGRDAADLSHPAACAAAIEAHAPTAVINAAAYTNVDGAEAEEDLANTINGDAPGAMAAACAAMDIPFVHISTDYVFPGDGDRPWKPDDTPAPLNAYGRTKLRGEDAVRYAGGRYAILRVSWVVSAHGNNFVKTMLRLGAERDKLTVVNDEIGGLTPARAIAAACIEIARLLSGDPAKAGTYHFSGAPDASWADVAREVFRQAGLSCDVENILAAEYPPRPAKRPLNSRMDCTATSAVFGIERPDWKAAIGDILSDLAASSDTA